MSVKESWSVKLKINGKVVWHWCKFEGDPEGKVGIVQHGNEASLAEIKSHLEFALALVNREVEAGKSPAKILSETPLYPSLEEQS